MIIILTLLLYCLCLLNFRKSIFQKLYDLYIEECEKEPEVKVSIHFLCYYDFLNVVEEGNLKELDLDDLYFC